MDWKNKLYFGDNLGILREHVATESIDLIYLDPPFNSSATHGFTVAALYERRPLGEGKIRRSQTAATTTGEESAAQITALERVAQSAGFAVCGSCFGSGHDDQEAPEPRRWNTAS